MSSSDTDSTPETSKQRAILDLTCDQAKVFLLKQESYCRIDLPPYFHFTALLSKVDDALIGHNLSDLWSDSPRNCEGVNHLILNNKDGRHAWRPLQLIHPALYVSLVSRMTEKDNWKAICNRFAEFAKLEKITCLSLPVESLTEEKDKAAQVAHWWHEIEQKSISLALDYEYIVHADITDCYGAIYTHSIAWAIYGRLEAKNNRSNHNLIGNIIDDHIQDMSHGQTNGIPQGSVLMDCIAEMVLGYADLELADRIDKQTVTDYLVLRYRDDYRIFINNPQDGEKILKCLTEVMVGLGLKLNAGKTKTCNMVISESVKPDKFSWISKKDWDKSLQKHLLIIYSHSLEFPNTGSVAVAMADYYKRLTRHKTIHDPMPLISITVDIAYRNPRTYPICSAILSKLLSFIESEDEKKGLVRKIVKRFFQIPNTGHMEIWLQRISRPFAPDIEFNEPLCQLARGKDVSVWNNDWVSSSKLKRALDAKQIFDRDIAKKIDPIVPIKEVELFISKIENY
jgi:RNA-directed DNA polymerase